MLSAGVSAQYPTQDVIDRCVFMHYFDEETNDRINKMWENVKGESFPYGYSC